MAAYNQLPGLRLRERYTSRPVSLDPRRTTQPFSPQFLTEHDRTVQLGSRINGVHCSKYTKLRNSTCWPQSYTKFKNCFNVETDNGETFY